MINEDHEMQANSECYFLNKSMIRYIVNTMQAFLDIVDPIEKTMET